MATTTSDFTLRPNSFQANCFYAEILRQGSSQPVTGPSAKRLNVDRRWQPSASSTTRCFRCGGGGHLARDCREPVRCFRCGLYGHKRFNCSSYSFDKPTISNRSLAQAWNSMIFQADSSIPNSDYRREMMNEEQFQFNLNYLKLRKNLLMRERADTILLVRLLDGLFNSNYKVSTIASLLLDVESDDLVSDNEIWGICKDHIMIYSAPSSCSTEKCGNKDVILLDPWVSLCRNDSVSYCPPKERLNQLLNHFDVSPPSAADNLLREDLIKSDAVNVCSGAAYTNDYGKDILKLNMLPYKSTESYTNKDSCLVLFNSFELLDVCMEEEYSSESLDYCHNVSDEGACLSHRTTEEPLCIEDLDSAFDNKNLTCNGLLTNDLNSFMNLNGCLEEKYTCENVDFCLNETDVDPSILGNSAGAPLCLDAVSLDVDNTIQNPAYNGPCCIESLGLERGIEFAPHAVLECNESIEQVTGYDDSDGALFDATRACSNNCSKTRLIRDITICCDKDLKSTSRADVSMQDEMTTFSDYPSTSSIAGGVESCMATPPSGNRRGRKKKGFYESSTMRRSARLGRCKDRTVHTVGGLSESGAVGTSVSGADC